jgi:signal transduction histidine kinase/predicted negative regulator of RcsB-dependent stress response
MRKIPTIFLLLIAVPPLNMVGQVKFKVDSLVTELGITTTDSVRCRIMLEIATELRISDTSVALEFLEKGAHIAESLDDKSFLGRSYGLRGWIHTRSGHYHQALIAYDRALAAYNDADDDQGYYETIKDKGNVYLYLADYPQALNLYETSLEYYRKTGMVNGISRCLNNMGIIYKNQGHYLEALTVYDESIKLVDEQEDPMQVAQGYINMGNVFVYLGSYQRALDYFEKALAISEREEQESEIALCLLNTGVVQNKCGNFSEAHQYYNRALKIGRTLGDPVLVSNSLINIGTNYSEMGRLDEGLEFVEQGMKMKLDLGDERAISNCYIHQAEIYHKKEFYDRAIELFTLAVPVKEHLGDREGLARCYLGMSRTYLNQGNYNDGNRMADMALEIATGIHALEHLASGYEIKKDIAEAHGDFRSAYGFAMDLYRYRDSLMDDNTSKAVMEMEFRHRSRALENENENLKIQSGLSSELMKKRNAFLYSLAGIAILMAVGLILVIHFLRRLSISSQKLEEKNLVITRQNMKLDALNHTKDRMMSIIAHDLRGTIGNQLTAIEVLNKVESSGQPAIDRRKLLGNLKHSASYSLELLENLLHWSRLEGHETYYQPEMINLQNLVSGCLSLYDESSRSKGVFIHQEIDSNLMVNADRIMLETIARNLISNAIKFSEPGGSVTLSAQRKEDFVTFVVTDRGIGMTREQIEIIMNDGGFTRRGTANEKGAGIGMTLVRQFTALHKGRLEIRSKTGEGTSVEVGFPV